MTTQNQAAAPNDGKLATTCLLEPRDPLIFRDARPFAAEPGARAFSLEWPFPRTVAGALRTHLIRQAAGELVDWNQDTARQARAMAIHGPLLAARFPNDPVWHPYVPAPADVVPLRKTIDTPEGSRPSPDLTFMCLRPTGPDDGEGTSLPPQREGQGNGYQQALGRVNLQPLSITSEEKPAKDMPAWWSLESAIRWLGTTGTKEEDVRAALQFYRVKNEVGVDGEERIAGLSSLRKVERTHVAINPTTGTGIDGALFTTEARAFRDEPPTHDPTSQVDSGPRPAIAMLCRVSTQVATGSVESLLPLGGERRLTRVTVGSDDVHWPEPVVPDEEKRTSANGLRLQLVTPAIFTHGWLPGWMADGSAPGMRGLGIELELVGAAIGRRVPVSGWRLAHKPGPRATAWAVPAGGVYFFRLKRGELKPELFSSLWLCPVSDRENDRNEGFGLVLPGIW